MSKDNDLDKDNLGDIDNLEGFVDLEDLSDLGDFGDLSELGDLSDLGNLDDLPDVSDIPESEELPDVDDLPDADDLPEIDSIEDGSDLPSLDDIGDLSDTGDIDDLPGLDDLTDMMEADKTEESDMRTVEPEIPESKADVSEDSDIALDDILSLDNSTASEDDTMSPDDSTASEDDIMSLDEGDGSDDGIMSLDDIMSLDSEASGDKEEETENQEASGDGIDNMLDGLLDNLDMTGSLDEDVQGGNDGTADEAPLDIDALSENEEGMADVDDLLNMLGGDQPEDTASTEESGDSGAAIDNVADMLPQEKTSEEKKPGFFKRLFGNVINEEIAEAERQAKLDEEVKAEEDEKLKLEKEEAKKAAAEEKAAKKAEKAEAKAAKKAEKAEAKAAKKAEKEARKAEGAEAAANEVVGKLNKVGVTIVVVIAGIFLVSVIAGTNLFGYSSVKSNAEKYFRLGKYEDAYQEAVGSKLKDKDPEAYDKIVTVMKVQHSLDAYSNYEQMKYYPEALNSLLKGLKKYDDNIDTARQLGVEEDLGSCRRRIIGMLKDEFGISEKQAYNILDLDTKAYTDKVVEIATDKY